MPADTINRQLRGSFYRRNRLAFALAAAGALMGAVLNLIISWLMQQLIDTAAGTSGALPFRILVRACGGFFLLLFCGSAFVYCAKPRFLATAMEQYKNCAVTQLMQKKRAGFPAPALRRLPLGPDQRRRRHRGRLPDPAVSPHPKAVLLRRGAGSDADLFAAFNAGSHCVVDAAFCRVDGGREQALGCRLPGLGS